VNNPNDLRLDDESGAWFADPKRFKNGWSELSRATTFLENVWKFECKWMKGEYLSWFRGWNAGAFQGFIMWHHPTHDQKIRCSPMILFMWNSRTAEDFRYVAWTLKRVCQARAYSSCIYHIYYIIYIIFNFPKHLVNYTYEIMHPLVIYIYTYIYILVGGLEHDFYALPYIGNNDPNWRTHIFQRGRYTTNQYMCV
jgi:hypothetical protein